MAGMKLTMEESEVTLVRQAAAASELMSDDDRSVAADSWSIKSEYGSTLDDEQRHADAAEALSAASYRVTSDYSSDKEEEEDQDGDGVSSILGFQSHWDATYADELSNFREHGQVGEIWFGSDVMETVCSWTKSLCIDIALGHSPNHVGNTGSDHVGLHEKDLSRWSVLDIGTGNGLLLQELAKQGFYDLTGIDYSEGAIDLARNLANRDGFPDIRFLVDDILETKLQRKFLLVTDKGTLDAIGLHPDGPIKRIMYWDSVSKLVAPGGLLVITSCNNTKDELIEEVSTLNQRRRNPSSQELEVSQEEQLEPPRDHLPPFRYLDHVRSYPTFMFGGSIGSRVATVAFVKN